MTTVVGVFNSFSDAKRGVAILRSLGIPENHISILAPGTSDAKFEATLPAIEAEQPGMGRAVGGTVGGAIGIAAGATVGAATATISRSMKRSIGWVSKLRCARAGATRLTIKRPQMSKRNIETNPRRRRFGMATSAGCVIVATSAS